MIYLFELGRIRNLSLAELNSLLGEENLVEVIDQFALYNLKKPLEDPQAFQDRLGGTIRMAQVVDSFPLKSAKTKSKIEQALEHILTDHFKGRSGKIPFAITAINVPDRSYIFLKFFLNFSKKILKSLGFNSRFVNKPWSNPTSAQIYKSHSVDKGIDLTIIASGTSTNGDRTASDTLYIAKTLSIQNIDRYSYRDYYKPFRDPRMGMLPPKLAQIMINLAGDSLNTIYDPFCGSGTILMEAMLQQRNVIGSDIDEKAVEGTLANLCWLVGNFDNTTKEFAIFKKDAREIKLKDLPETPDAIITETHLGPPVNRIPKEENLKKTFENLTDLHANWLSRIAEIIPPKSKTKIVLCLPAFRESKNHYIRFPNFQEIAKHADLRIVNKESLIYDRPDQIVAREIVVLEKA